MIKKVKFKNYRNLDGLYIFNESLNVIVGKNSTGKSNLLDGICLAFKILSGDYCKVFKSDFLESDDSEPITIWVQLCHNAFPSLQYRNSKNELRCGFKVVIRKTANDRYIRNVTLLNGAQVDMEIVRDDPKLPNVNSIPLIRIEDLYTPGLSVGILDLIDSEEKYKGIMAESRQQIKNEIKEKEDKFKNFCNKFNADLKIDVTNPKISNEKLYIVEGDKEHNSRIGAGYKSIANIVLNTIDTKYNIVLIDELENHLHPSLARSLIREIRGIPNTIIIATTHSPVIVNELKLEEIMHISGKRLDDLNFENKSEIISKLNRFLHPGRNELIFSDNIVFVEGYTEEVILNNYLKKNNENWTIVNVAGVMFLPYIALGILLEKHMIVVSDNDKSTTEDKSKSARYINLEFFCNKYNVKIIEVENTLESDLYINGYMCDECKALMKEHDKHSEYFIAKSKKKTEIADIVIKNEVDLTDWHVIRGIHNEFKSN